MLSSPLPLRSKRISLSGPVRVARRQSSSSKTPPPMPLTARRSTSPMPSTNSDGDNRVTSASKGSAVLTINTNVESEEIIRRTPSNKKQTVELNMENENFENNNSDHRRAQNDSSGLQFSDDVLALASPSFKSIKRRTSALGTAAR